MRSDFQFVSCPPLWFSLDIVLFLFPVATVCSGLGQDRNYAKKKQPSDKSQDDFVKKDVAFRSQRPLEGPDGMPSDIKCFDLTLPHSQLPFKMFRQ